ncbi:hypothetical protein ABES21_10415, partial [Peribacillus frigoritolerans]|uniref:hypothetical protein n=1 Tax=Peribacillus frigoritolerans TaxID=450367 RepID=UPI003D2BA388
RRSLALPHQSTLNSFVLKTTIFTIRAYLKNTNREVFSIVGVSLVGNESKNYGWFETFLGCLCHGCGSILWKERVHVKVVL